MRKFTPVEINHLIKFGFDPFEVAKTASDNIPVEYITGKAEFYGNVFNVNQNVLIPRVESEKLLDIALEFVKNNLKNPIISFADIGTGSGCIGISFASELKRRGILFEGYLSDIYDDAIKVTKQNVDNILSPKHQNCFTNKVGNSQLKIIKSNLFENYPKNKNFDIIFANLPYIPTSRIKNLDKSVKDFEPILALDGGIDGLEYIRRLLNVASTKLKEKGIVILEVDDTHDESKVKEFQSEWDTKVKRDLNGKVRYWLCGRGME